jgi:hypothetical protein
MALNPPFIKTLVQAGDPLTAQGWNDVVEAISALYTHINTREESSVKVQVAAPNIPSPAAIRVTATRADGISAEAVRPVPPDTFHTFSGLAPGSYTLRAEAPGYTPATITVAVPPGGLTAAQNLTLAKQSSFMPITFGATLTATLARLANLQIAVNQVLDVSGISVPADHPSAVHGAARVLMQFPPPGTPVAPGEFAQLVISARLVPEATSRVPSLVGMTVAQATAALDAVGLKVGTMTTGRKTATPSTGGTPIGGGLDQTHA